MIDLSGVEYFGKGGVRACYVHPENPDRCIKILQPAILGNPYVLKKAHKQVSREQAYYKRLQKRGISWSHLAQSYGTIETSEGPGDVFDLIRDFDGEVSKTLEYYFADESLTGKYFVDLKKGLRDLFQYIKNEQIITTNIKWPNLVYKRLSEEKGQIIIIDDIGTAVLIPLVYYFESQAKTSIERKIDRFKELSPLEFPQNKLIGDLFK